MRALVNIDPVRLAIVFAVVIGVLGILGAIEVRYQAAPAFDLDAEYRLPAFVAGLILLVAAAAAVLASLWDPASGRWPWLVLAGLFTVMAADEALSIHEALEDLTGVDWQTLYLPVMVVAAAAWLVVLMRLRERPLLAAVLVTGGVAWVGAAALEAVQWTGPMENERAVDGYGILMGIEELLEMTGSACFALAPLAAARGWADVHRAETAPAPLAAGAPR